MDHVTAQGIDKCMINVHYKKKILLLLLYK